MTDLIPHSDNGRISDTNTSRREIPRRRNRGYEQTERVRETGETDSTTAWLRSWTVICIYRRLLGSIAVSRSIEIPFF